MQLDTEILHYTKLGCDHGGVSLLLWPRKVYPDYSIVLLDCAVHKATKVTAQTHKTEQ